MIATEKEAEELQAVKQAKFPAQAPNGPFAAATLAAGIGCALYGAAVLAASASPAFKNLMNWWNPAGPLVGKTSVGVIAWLVAWGLLHFIWRSREVQLSKVWKISLVLLAIGFALTFPPVFEAFEAH
jgi:hypothetical protein